MIPGVLSDRNSHLAVRRYQDGPGRPSLHGFAAVGLNNAPLQRSVFRKDEALTPVSATRSQTEKKYWAKGSYEWLAPGQVHMDITKSSRPHRDEVLEWAGTVRDLLGMIWWLRTLDYDQAGLRPGPNALLIDHDALPVTIASYQKKTFKYKGQSVPVIEVTLSQEGKEALHLTLSDDERRQPLRFSIGLPFGTIKGTLK